jgi:hypothetical protein
MQRKNTPIVLYSEALLEIFSSMRRLDLKETAGWMDLMFYLSTEKGKKIGS